MQNTTEIDEKCSSGFEMKTREKKTQKNQPTNQPTNKRYMK